MATTSLKNIRIATRQSKLALWQANYICKQLLIHYPELQINLVPMLTSGDRQTSDSAFNGKSLFVKELQTALLNDSADIAVHSIKDMSVHDVAGLHLSAICQRHDPRDVLISQKYTSLDQFTSGGRIGTNSPRRQAQILALRSDLQVLPLRGNIDTRLQRAVDGDFDAIILAAAGLQRLGLEQHITSYLDPTVFLPAIAQGAIGVECRSDDTQVRDMLMVLDHLNTRYSVIAERAVNQHLRGDCYTPVGVFSELTLPQISLHGMVGSRDGKTIIRATQTGPVSKSQDIGYELAEKLLSQGAGALLS